MSRRLRLIYILYADGPGLIQFHFLSGPYRHENKDMIFKHKAREQLLWATKKERKKKKVKERAEGKFERSLTWGVM